MENIINYLKKFLTEFQLLTNRDWMKELGGCALKYTGLGGEQNEKPRALRGLPAMPASAMRHGVLYEIVQVFDDPADVIVLGFIV